MDVQQSINKGIIGWPWWALGLLALALVSYANSFPGVFILDDHSIVELNPLVHNFELVKLLTTDYWGEFVHTGLFRPVTTLSLYLNRAILGEAAWGFHLVNLLLHAAVTLLAFAAMTRYGVPRRAAWLGAALFAVHPIHTEVLNIVVGRSELLVAFFVFAALVLYREERLKTGWRFGLVAACYLLALLSKEHAVVLVPMVLLFDAILGAWRDRGWKTYGKIYLLLLAETLLWLAWRSWGVEHDVQPVIVEPAVNPLYFMAPLPRLLTALKIQWVYLGKLLWPADLRAIYSGSGWLEPISGLTSWQGLVVLSATTLLLLLIVWGCRRGNWPALGMALYVMTVLPTANLLTLTGVVMAERLTYLPSLWFCLALAAVAVQINRRSVLVLLSVLLVGGLMARTLVRNVDFAGETMLWQREVTRDPQNVLAWLNLADSFAGAPQGENNFRGKLALPAEKTSGEEAAAGALRALEAYDDEMIAYFQRTGESVQVDLPNRWFFLAKAHLRKREYVESLRWLEKSRPWFGDYGAFWEVAAMNYEGQGRVREAIDAFRQAGPFSPESEVPMRLGNLLMGEGRYAEAEEVYRQGSLAAERADLWNGLGVALILQGKRSQAEEAFARAVTLQPDSWQYQENYRRVRQVKSEP